MPPAPPAPPTRAGAARAGSGPVPPPNPGPATARSSPRSPLSPAALAAAGLAAYAVALLATLPARVVAPVGSAAAGTVWHGSATPAGMAGATVDWDVDPGASLATASLAARWTLAGGPTRLTGLAHRRFTGVDLAEVRGRAGWGLVAALVPGVPAECTMTLDVALDRVAADATRGTVATLPGTCPRPGGPPRAVPRLLATFAGGGGRVTTWTDRTTTLATVAVAGRWVAIHLTAAGAAILPGPGRPGEIEFTL